LIALQLKHWLLYAAVVQVGTIIEALTGRKGELLEVAPVEHGFGAAAANNSSSSAAEQQSSSSSSSEGSGSVSSIDRQRLVFEVPARGMIGFKTFFAGITRGEGLMQRAFARCALNPCLPDACMHVHRSCCLCLLQHFQPQRCALPVDRESQSLSCMLAGLLMLLLLLLQSVAVVRYGPYRGPISGSRKGVLVSMSDGRSTTYAMYDLVQRGTFFIAPGEDVYAGMVVGENNR
jgi:predicted membrane GTPase involved in stress response